MDTRSVFSNSESGSCRNCTFDSNEHLRVQTSQRQILYAPAVGFEPRASYRKYGFNIPQHGRFIGFSADKLACAIVLGSPGQIFSASAAVHIALPASMFTKAAQRALNVPDFHNSAVNLELTVYSISTQSDNSIFVHRPSSAFGAIISRRGKEQKLSDACFEGQCEGEGTEQSDAWSTGLRSDQGEHCGRPTIPGSTRKRKACNSMQPGRQPSI